MQTRNHTNMKKMYLPMLVIMLIPTDVFAQQLVNKIYLSSTGKSTSFYVELSELSAFVYSIGQLWDKAGTGYKLLGMDTLSRQHDGNYFGSTIRIHTKEERALLEITHKKPKNHVLDTLENPLPMYFKLNNAYFLNAYFAMTVQINKRYPLNHYSYRNSFDTWDNLKPDEKKLAHSQFRSFADNFIKIKRDSICVVQDVFVSLTNNLLSRINEIEYDSLKEVLTSLPVEYKGRSWYFGTIVNEVSKKHPEFYFRIAEDFSEDRSIVFTAAEDNKEVISNLKNVNGYDEVKAKFFKERRMMKRMPYQVLGTYVVFGGLVAGLILSH